jgi:hypothetical protein
MLMLKTAPQSVESIRTAIVVFAVIAVVFWRVLLKFVLMIAAVLLIILLTSGVILLFESFNHAAK